MKKEKPWHEDDSFWETVNDVMFTRNRMDITPAEIDRVLNILGVEENAHILDLCCGVGRHSIELARRGYKITGIDRTRSYLDRAKQSAMEENLTNIEFIEADMRTFCSPDTFDAVINLYTSFGYFEDPEDDKRVLQNIHKSLRAGGNLLLEMMGKEVLARIFQRTRWHEEEDGTLILQESRVCEGFSWIENRWIIIKGGKRADFRVDHRLYSAKELTTLITECGFMGFEVYGDLERSPYDEKAKRLIVVAWK
ncbi:MAG: hypothetical protein B6D57_02925 [Candidatus Coatesbacteria bacterium 4484_99]|uniref:Methyltransferase domain-containing protein n=1 Tax=Candidatus Coatesbacteria bacterium 4484_99 TaxID=1970774 RepID=A0A1W9S169_9BACT|nr:MAG: hypothetical protein B6D57_02925 [Candidatus Coatesbacteria bacterium 4484_99]